MQIILGANDRVVPVCIVLRTRINDASTKFVRSYMYVQFCVPAFVDVSIN